MLLVRSHYNILISVVDRVRCSSFSCPLSKIELASRKVLITQLNLLVVIFLLEDECCRLQAYADDDAAGHQKHMNKIMTVQRIMNW